MTRDALFWIVALRRRPNFSEVAVALRELRAHTLGELREGALGDEMERRFSVIDDVPECGRRG